MRWRWLWVAVALAGPAFGQGPREKKVYTFRHPAMGTQFVVYLYARSEAEASGVAGEVFDEVDRIEQELSNYRETSELSRIVREAAAAQVTTDPETFRFLEESQHWSEVSGGAFDITVGPLMKVWGFFEHGGHVPSHDELERVRPMVAYRNVELDAAARTVHFRVAGVDLDPGGIGKGFAVDAGVAILRARGVSAALISAGSSTVYALGAPPGKQGWTVVVPDGLPDHATISTVVLRDTSLSSANCNEKNFMADGHLYCHIMDPRTLRPVEGRLHVSVIDPVGDCQRCAFERAVCGYAGGECGVSQAICAGGSGGDCFGAGGCCAVYGLSVAGGGEAVSGGRKVKRGGYPSSTSHREAAQDGCGSGGSIGTRERFPFRQNESRSSACGEG